MLCLLLSWLQLLCRKISWLAHLSFLLLPISGKGGCSWHLQVLQRKEKEYSLYRYTCIEYVSLSVISRGRLLTSPLIIPDITKTSSNNCLWSFNKFAQILPSFGQNNIVTCICHPYNHDRYPAIYIHVVGCQDSWESLQSTAYPYFFKFWICFVDNLLNNKTIILLNLAEYHLVLTHLAYGLIG